MVFTRFSVGRTDSIADSAAHSRTNKPEYITRANGGGGIIISTARISSLIIVDGVINESKVVDAGANWFSCLLCFSSCGR